MYFKDIVLLWSRAIVELRDSIGRVPGGNLNTSHHDLFRRVRIVANNMKSHLILF